MDKLTMEIEDLDELVVREIKERCSGEDCEINGCNLDDIVKRAFTFLGMNKSVKAFNDVDCWRA